MSDRDQISAHLEFFGELGVDGISRDAAWRTRPAERPAVTRPAERPAVTRPAERPAVTRPAERAAVTRPAERPAVTRPEERPAVTRPEERPVVQASAPDASPSPGGRAAPAADAGQAGLDHIRTDLGECTRCKLHTGRTKLVFGVGNPEADLMFVGEAPGRDEDRQGIPFVGRAGQLLTKIIEAIDLQRDDVYIANVVKCRPPDNRNPEPDEVQTCEPFLFAQIDAIRPRVIVALGSFAVRTLLRDEKTPISKARGRVYNFRGAKLIPTFHPAFLLRSPDRKRDVWEDMKKVRAILRED